MSLAQLVAFCLLLFWLYGSSVCILYLCLLCLFWIGALIMYVCQSIFCDKSAKLWMKICSQRFLISTTMLNVEGVSSRAKETMIRRMSLRFWQLLVDVCQGGFTCKDCDREHIMIEQRLSWLLEHGELCFHLRGKMIFFDQEWNATHLLTKRYCDIDFPHDKLCIENYVAWRK